MEKDENNIQSGTGLSTNLIPLLRVYEESNSHYINNGGGKRKVNDPIIEPWHSDLIEFISKKIEVREEKKN